MVGLVTAERMAYMAGRVSLKALTTRRGFWKRVVDQGEGVVRVAMVCMWLSGREAPGFSWS